MLTTVTLAFQASLFGGSESVRSLPQLAAAQRVALTNGAWIDVLPGWLDGADDLFERLLRSVPWHGKRRQMYDRVVAVPRLLSFYDAGETLPDSALMLMRDELNRHYRAELGEEFATAGLCLYRDGRDSVAWHGDIIGRGRTQDTMVAIVSVGAPRSLLLRPRSNGPSNGASDEAGSGGGTLRYELGHGDLLVMGGSCQRTWEHAVPKSARVRGPRISIQFRPQGVR